MSLNERHARSFCKEVQLPKSLKSGNCQARFPMLLDFIDSRNWTLLVRAQAVRYFSLRSNTAVVRKLYKT